MGDHFLVDELIPFGDLDDAVEHHYPAVGCAFENQDILEIRTHAGELSRDQKALPPIRVQRFTEPHVDRHLRADQGTRPRRCSLSWILPGLKAAFSVGIER